VGVYRLFGGWNCLHLQGEELGQRGNQQEAGFKQISAELHGVTPKKISCLLDLRFSLK
jgi:hypothetical protein